MVVQVFKFKSGLSDADAMRVIEERAPRYRALKGLLQKYYVRDPETGEYGGIYIWDNEASLREFRQSDLARTIAAAFEVKDPPRAETFELVFDLRGQTMVKSDA